jgi:2-keto-4-pentenoate hydratase/2-oxohepta-3-ene-1,7-dioic acid hydratase in catechol pathway
MKIARVISDKGEITTAAQIEDGRLVRIAGDILSGDGVATDETVQPRAWLPPIEPRAIFCIGRNYAEHAAEGGAPPPDYPILFMKNPNAAIGHLEPIRLPKACEDEVDYEGELVVVIRKPALDVACEKALDYVLGYTVGHDVSARVWQGNKGGSQWCRGKSFDSFAPLGPVMVTADEVPDPQQLTITTTLNGKVVQHASTSKMIFSVAFLISFLSQDTTLLPGTVIMTGTPEGIGWARTPKLTLRPGDTASVEIGGIGCLTNEVVGG